MNNKCTNLCLTNEKIEKVRKMDIFLAELPSYDDERDTNIQTGIRPVLVYSNDKCNAFSPVITVIPITSKDKKMLPTHLFLNENLASIVGLRESSVIIGEGITSISKKRLIKKIGYIKFPDVMEKIKEIVDIQLGN